MALKPLQAALPLGQFDALDADLLGFKGGEVCSFTSVVNTAATDVAAWDSANDGYLTPNKRAVLTKQLTSGMRPLMLADDGIAGYGTLFGTVVGGTVGQVSYGPTSTVASGDLLGPSTARGSGKITAWATPGLFAVSLDAVDTTASTGLTLTNTTLATGAKLYATTAGLLTPNTSAKFEDIAVCRFIDFEGSNALVTTPNYLASALASAKTASYTFAVVHYDPGV